MIKEQKNAIQEMLDNTEEQAQVLQDIHAKAERTYLTFKNLPLAEKVRFAFADMTWVLKRQKKVQSLGLTFLQNAYDT